MATKTLHFPSPRHLTSLYGGREENLVHAERALGVKLVTREDWLRIDAPAEPLAKAEALFGFLDIARAQGMTIRTPDFHRIADSFARGEGNELRTMLDEPLVIATNRKTIVPRPSAKSSTSNRCSRTRLSSASAPPARARLTSRWPPPFPPC